MNDSMAGIRVSLSPYVPKTKWEFPSTPFVEYEAKDERWCRAFGIGKEVLCIIEVNGAFMMHPDVWEGVKKSPAMRPYLS